jgi:proline dehydrogenase
MRKFNRGKRAVVFNTYQMYLKRSAANLRRHVELAEEQGWKLGVKLVRGAYLHSDPRELICDTKSDTDVAYDDAARMLITRGVDTVVASHNRESVMKALALKRRGEGEAELVFAQLMGMADELSLGLVQEGTRVLKYAVWGGTGECVKYLLRRAEENKDAVGRSEENYRAVMDELRRRCIGV